MEGSEGGPKLDFDQRIQSMTDLRNTLEDIVFSGGEPTPNPNLPALIAAATRLNDRLIGLITSGVVSRATPTREHWSRLDLMRSHSPSMATMWRVAIGSPSGPTPSHELGTA